MIYFGYSEGFILAI